MSALTCSSESIAASRSAIVPGRRRNERSADSWAKEAVGGQVRLDHCLIRRPAPRMEQLLEEHSQQL
ncbi:hypothetical protein [Streptomyces sp. NPDC002889]|uniref:hypothetical protein n=1 Tax=Streptomyces sp. NPDC002889 TaxID=3364669 RepID=UPI00369E0A76